MSARESGTSPRSAPNANAIWRTRVAAFGDKIALRYRLDDAWHTLSWRQADEAAREIAAALCSFGLEVGERVAILCQTRFEWLLCDVAIAMAGLVSVPIYPSTTKEECEFFIANSEAQVVIAEDAQQVAKLASIVSRIASLRLIHIEEGPNNESLEGSRLAKAKAEVQSYGGILPCSLAFLRQEGRAFLAGHPGELDVRAGSVQPQDTFTIIYTSGTTGQPKGVVLTHANLVSSCESAVRAFDLRPSDVQYMFLPLAHVLGREIEWAPILVGSEIAFAESLARIKYDLVEVQPTFLAGVPRIFEKLHSAVLAGAQQGSKAKRALVTWALAVAGRYSAAVRASAPVPWRLKVDYALADKLVFSRLRKRLGLARCRFLISGGAPLAAEIAEFFHGVGLLILEGYGLTETTAAAFVNRKSRFRFGTVGPAIDIIAYRIAEDGEILLRGPSVFTRYHKNPKATSEAIDSEGWFHTGDVGVVEDEFLRLVDRKKDIIATAGGKKIAPQKFENALKAHCPLVGQVVVFGDKHSYCVALVTPSEVAVRQHGEGDVAQAARSPGLRTRIERAIADLNSTLASYETVKAFAILPADFSEASGELTPSLKVKRDVVASKFAGVVDGLYGK